MYQVNPKFVPAEEAKAEISKDSDDLKPSFGLNEDKIELTESAELYVSPDVAGDDIEDLVSPQYKLIIVKLTSTLTTLVTKTETDSATTVGITYSGCIPTDVPEVAECPSL